MGDGRRDDSSVFKHLATAAAPKQALEKEGATKIGKVINKPQNESVPPYGNLGALWRHYCSPKRGERSGETCVTGFGNGKTPQENRWSPVDDDDDVRFAFQKEKPPSSCDHHGAGGRKNEWLLEKPDVTYFAGAVYGADRSVGWDGTPHSYGMGIIET